MKEKKEKGERDKTTHPSGFVGGEEGEIDELSWYKGGGEQFPKVNALVYVLVLHSQESIP
jgi:hypothetical protein